MEVDDIWHPEFSLIHKTRFDPISLTLCGRNEEVQYSKSSVRPKKARLGLSWKKRKQSDNSQLRHANPELKFVKSVDLTPIFSATSIGCTFALFLLAFEKIRILEGIV